MKIPDNFRQRVEESKEQRQVLSRLEAIVQNPDNKYSEQEAFYNLTYYLNRLDQPKREKALLTLVSREKTDLLTYSANDAALYIVSGGVSSVTAATALAYAAKASVPDRNLINKLLPQVPAMPAHSPTTRLAHRFPRVAAAFDEIKRGYQSNNWYYRSAMARVPAIPLMIATAQTAVPCVAGAHIGPAVLLGVSAGVLSQGVELIIAAQRAGRIESVKGIVTPRNTRHPVSGLGR